MKSASENRKSRKTGSWTFLSNHAHVLVCLARDPNARLRDVAEQVGITERATHKIVVELEDAGVVRRIREGRRNRYHIELSCRLRHPLENDKSVGGLLETLLGKMAVRRLRADLPAAATRPRQ